MPIRSARIVRIHCPVDASTHAALLAGDATALDRDPVAGPLLDIIAHSDVFGDFGLYRGVVEITPGWERFVPGVDAAPAEGTAGDTSTLPNVVLTTYIDVDVPADAFQRAIDALMAAHPWEVPMIEIGDVRLATR